MDKLNRIMGSIKKKEKKMCVSIIDCIKHGRGLHDVNHRFWKSICKECGGLPDLSSHHLFTLKSVSFALCFILFLSIHQLFHFHQTSNVCDVSTFSFLISTQVFLMQEMKMCKQISQICKFVDHLSGCLR